MSDKLNRYQVWESDMWFVGYIYDTGEADDQCVLDHAYEYACEGREAPIYRNEVSVRKVVFER